MPQGTTLGPLLFIINANELANYINSAELILFADDTVIFSANEDLSHLNNNLQATLDSLSIWCRYNKLSINLRKSQVMSLQITTKTENS